MRSKNRVCLFVLLALTGIDLGLAGAQQAVEISPSQAKEHLQKRIEPEYPPLAQVAGVQGSVLLEIRIDKSGQVTETKVKRGPPLLVPAAIKALKQWRFEPFNKDQEPTDVTTSVELPFSLGTSPAENEKQREINDHYFKQENQCRNLVKSHKYEEADQVCREGVMLAEQLPAGRGLERSDAYSMIGWACMGERKYAEGSAALPPRDCDLRKRSATL